MVKTSLKIVFVIAIVYLCVSGSFGLADKGLAEKGMLLVKKEHNGVDIKQMICDPYGKCEDCCLLGIVFCCDVQLRKGLQSP
ncbi:hypothetical protein QVD17_16257 [Tagetes erecta]|uniref:Uncharacterized protein n=1 Tax=Tagetes erecta TaxID=13708 RepID=A0AAD8KRT7_TARER|nr:hypothetical protein QVD17_16257 [Tagetes erecta]